VCVMKRDEAEDTPNVVTDPVIVLFDSGASHSFVTSSVIDKLKLVSSPGLPTISVITSIRDSMWCKKTFTECPI